MPGESVSHFVTEKTAERAAVQGRAEIEERAAEMVREAAVSAALAEAARVRAPDDRQVIGSPEQDLNHRELAARSVVYPDSQEYDDMPVDEEEAASADDSDSDKPGPAINNLSPTTRVRVDSETGSVIIMEPDSEGDGETEVDLDSASSDTSSDDEDDEDDENILSGTKFFKNTRIPATGENAALLAKERVEEYRTRKAYTEPLPGGRRIAPSGASTPMGEYQISNGQEVAHLITDLYRGGLNKEYELDPRERSRRELSLFQSAAQKVSFN